MDTALYFGESPATRLMMADVAIYAPSPENLLLTGASGTGKTMLAREIHRRSGRTGQFVATSAPALHTLSLGTLVGSIRGAFTSADRNRTGLLVQAAGGTLFIDEICHANAELQSLLLSILEAGQFWPVGAERPVPANFRLITAANRPLDDGTFLPELLARIDLLEIAVPDLKERRRDIVPMAQCVLGTLASRHKRPAPGLTSCAARTLTEQAWEMNIRGMQKALLRAMLHCNDRLEISGADLAPHLPVRRDDPTSFRKHVTPPSVEIIQAVLDSCGGDFRVAGPKLNYSPDYLRVLYQRSKPGRPTSIARSGEIAPDLDASADAAIA